MISFIAIDVDGTLYDDNHEVSKKNIKAISKALSKNIGIVLCSGRPPASLQEVNKEIFNTGNPVWTVGLNGAVVFNSHNLEVIFEARIPAETSLKIINYIKREFSGTSLSIHTNYDEIFVEEKTEEALEYGNLVKLPVVKIDSFDKEIKNGVLKIQIHYHQDILEKIYKNMKKENNQFEMFMSQKNYLEFAPIKTNKGMALEKLGDKLGKPVDEYFASIGDNGNDFEMIEKSRIGIAVKNAIDEVKKISDYVTERNNNESAVEEAIKYIFDKNSS